MARQVTLADFLTDDEIRLCIQWWTRRNSPVSFVDEVEAKIIKPNIDRINKALGQPNDTRYLAYCVEYVMSQGGK